MSRGSHRNSRNLSSRDSRNLFKWTYFIQCVLPTDIVLSLTLVFLWCGGHILKILRLLQFVILLLWSVAGVICITNGNIMRQTGSLESRRTTRTLLRPSTTDLHKTTVQRGICHIEIRKMYSLYYHSILKYIFSIVIREKKSLCLGVLFCAGLCFDIV